MQTLLEIGLVNAVMATGLAFVVALIGRVYRRPAVLHLLWILVLVKLLTPPALWVPFTLPAALTSSPIDSRTIEPDPPLAASDFAPEDLAWLTLETSRLGDVDGAWPEPDACLTAMEDPPVADQTSSPVETATAFLPMAWITEHWPLCMFVAWLVGSLGCFVVSGVRIYRFHRLLRFGRPASVALQQEAEQVAQRIGLQACPLLWIVPGKVSPLLWAVGTRTRLILPADLLGQLRPDQLSTLFAHELAHARRRDHWVRWLELAATSLYWWHPVAWWARNEIQQAEEQCCDAWVVQLFPRAAKAYARTLLQTVDFLDAQPALPPVASGIGHVHLLKRRLTMIVREPLSPRVPWPLQLGALCVGLLVLPFAPQRLEANSQNGVAASVAALNAPASARDDEQSDDTPSSRSQRDLERRMQRMEERMDRMMRLLESRTRESDGARPRTSSGTAQKQASEAEKKEKEAAARAKELAKTREKAAAERAKAAKALAERRAKESGEGTKATTESPRRTITSNIDPETAKRIEKQIHDAIHQALNPERMKQLEQQIQRAVDQSLSPERMKQLQRQIEAAVNPQRMEAMAKRIEEAVNSSLNAEAQERSARRREEAARATRARDEERAREERGRAERAREEARTREAPRTTTQSRSSTTSTQGRDRDLERRIDKIEQKLDKLIESLRKKSE